MPENIIDLPMETSVSRRYRVYLWLGLIFFLLYGFLSIGAMNNLWKYHVDLRFPLSLSAHPINYFYDVGMNYLFTSMVALAVALVLFYIFLRKTKVTRGLPYALAAEVLIAFGIFFSISSLPEEPTFMEYLEGKFYPFWAFTLSTPMVLGFVVTRLNKKARSSGK